MSFIQPPAGQSRLFPTTMFKKPISQMSYASFGAPGRLQVEFTKESLDALDDLWSWAENVARHRLPQAEDMVAQTMAMIAGGYAQKYSAGMKKHQRDQTRSWAMPVPRITEKYFLGWRVERVRRGTWMLTNDSREAYFIEFGIHRNPATGAVAPRRIRRPVMKLALKGMLEMIDTSSMGNRVWTGVAVPKPGQPGRRSNLIHWSQPSGVMGTTTPRIVGLGRLKGGGIGYVSEFDF